MFFNQNRSINLDISVSCSLKCPACFRQTNGFSSLRTQFENLSVDNFFKIATYFEEVSFCGTIGDPVLHPKFIEFLEIGRQKGVTSHIATADSTRPLNWYKDAFLADPEAFWVFGIDGLPESSHRYRVNQDGKKLFQVMLYAREVGMNVRWQYIIFNYNQSEIEEAKHLAKQYEIPLQIRKTNRHGSDLAPDYIFTHHWDKGPLKDKLTPKCFKGFSLGYSAMGYILPCCWFADLDVEKNYPDLCNSRTKLSNVSNVEEIFNSEGWKRLETRLMDSSKEAYSVCWHKCQAGKGDSWEVYDLYLPEPEK